MESKDKIFERFNIDEFHNIWDDRIDNWMSVEIYRLMHDGNLPPIEDESTIWIYNFMVKSKSSKWWAENVMSRPNWGSLFLTGKRLLYANIDTILKELQNGK